MIDALLPCLEIEPQQPAEAAVIWLHGLGADGHDFEPIVPALGLDDLCVRFVFPHAPKRPVTINQGYVMRAWYDIYGLDRSSGLDEAGIRESSGLLCRLIEREQARGIPCSRMVLAGFSQGGAIVLHTGPRHAETFAGILALSCYLPFEDKFLDERSEAGLKTPIFLAHGSYDPTVSIAYGQQSRRFLQDNGYPVAWRDYPMGHSLCPQEVTDIAAWLRSVLTNP